MITERLLKAALFAIPLLFAILAIPQAAPTSQQTASESADTVFRAESDLALVRFQVIAKKSSHVEDLRADEIDLREDGVPQRIAVFEGGKLYPRTTSLDVHLLFDCSSSIHQAKVLNPHVFSASLLDEFSNVRVGVWGFSGLKAKTAAGKKIWPVIKRFAGPTRDTALLAQAIDAVNGMQPGATPLYKALVGLLHELRTHSDSAPIVVVISDGLPDADSAGPGDVVTAAREAGISIFPALVHAQYSLFAPPQMNPAQVAFRDLGQATGGVDFVFGGGAPDDLVDRVLKGLAEQIRYEYVVGYSPDRSAGKGKHKVQVVLKNRNRGQVIGGAREVER